MSAAQQLDYKVRGCAAIDIIEPHKAIGLYQLTRGSVVVAIDGYDSEVQWRSTFQEAQELFWVMRAELREPTV